MTFKFNALLILVFILGISSVETYAQNQNITQIRAYISRANAALTNNEWNSALESINEAQKLAGQNGAVFESIRVRAYFGKKEYSRAKQSMEAFYNLSPSQSAINEIVAYETMIDDEIQEEKDRIERLKRQEEAKQEREAEKQREYQELVNSIVIGEEAVVLANQIRKDLARLPNMFNKLRNLPRDIKGTWGRQGTWQVAGGYHEPDVTADFIYRTAYGSTSFDYSLSSEYIRIDFTTKFAVLFDNSEDGRSLEQTCRNNYSVGDKLYNNTKMTHRFSSTSSQPFDKTTVLLSFSEISDNDNYVNSSYPNIISCGISPMVERYQNSVNRANKRLVESAYNAAKYRIDDIAKRISLTDRQSIAYSINKNEFEWYFLKALYGESTTTYSSLKREKDNILLAQQRREAERKAKEEKRIQNEATLTTLKSAVNTALEKDDYKTALKKLTAYRDLKQEMGKDTKSEDIAIAEYQEKITENENTLKRASELIVDENTWLSSEEENLNKALELQPSNASFKNKLEQIEQQRQVRKVNYILSEGDELLKENNISKAISTYRTALNVFPNDEKTLNRIKIAEGKLDTKAESKGKLLEDIRKELENNDSYDIALVQSAKTRVLDFIKDYPNDIELLVTATDLFLQEKLGLEEAKNLAEKVFSLEPKNVANLSNLGEIHYQNNELEKSLKFFQDAWDSGNTDDPNTLKRLSQGNYTLYLRTKDNVYADNALKFAQHAKGLDLGDSIYSRVINKFCTETTSCNE